jgi:indolepyruvate ferredoxin oxidoreductase alpha subunit
MSMKMTGEEGLSRVLRENNIALITGVYGDPCTTLLDQFYRDGLHVEISAEEKISLAQALGASVIGKRAAVAVKQVGMNVLADPLATSATHSIGAGLVIFAGDDPGAEKSQDEQDSRWFGKLMGIPVMTPRDADHLARSTKEAFELSERLGIPVILQFTGRVTKNTSEIGSYQIKTTGKFDRTRPWGRLILERYKYLHEEIYPKLYRFVEASPTHSMTKGKAKEGVISCGYVSTLVQHENHFALGYVHPLPEEKLAHFLKDLQKVLVVEEINPFVEEGVRAILGKHQLQCEVLGRTTGHLPRIGKLEKEHIENAFKKTPTQLDTEIKASVGTSILQLPCGGFEMLYQALDEVLPEDYLIAGDVGCNILHGYFPPIVVDTAYALGTSISTAAGMSLSGKKGIAIVGDTGFVHSGLTGLLNAVELKHNVLVIILHNKMSAMTPGAQGIPGIERIRPLIEACQPTAIDDLYVQKTNPKEIQSLLRKRLGEQGVHVMIAHAQARGLQG